MTLAIGLPVVVLAGGFGTRLRTAVADVPKPLAPAGEEPFLRHLLRSWVDQGARRFIFLLHHDAEKIERFLINEQHHGVLAGCEVTSIVEDRPLGTGGAVANAVNNGLLTGRFLVANADTWLGSGIGELARANAPAICAVHVTNTDRYGQVRLRGGHVDAFLEKTTGAGAGWINAGLYLLDAGEFSGWSGSAMSIEHDLFPRLAKSGVLGVVTVEADFIDIGIPEDYYRFCRWIESLRAANL